jgi:hypothetical protein
MYFLLLVLLIDYYFIIFLLSIYLQIIFKILINLDFFDIIDLSNNSFIFYRLYIIIVTTNSYLFS